MKRRILVLGFVFAFQVQCVMKYRPPSTATQPQPTKAEPEQTVNREKQAETETQVKAERPFIDTLPRPAAPALIPSVAATTAGNLLERGIASWYGIEFQGKPTSCGEVYDMNKLTAAHQTLPFHTLVEVRNLENSRIVTVRINDRGPFLKERVIDLSYKAAQELGMDAKGTAAVELRIVKPAEPSSIESNPTAVHYLIQGGVYQQFSNAREQLLRIIGLHPGVDFSVVIAGNVVKIVSDRITDKKEAERILQVLQRAGIESFIKEVY